MATTPTWHLPLHATLLAGVLLLGGVGCGGGDDDGGAAGDGGGGGGACAGEVTGDVEGGFSACVAAINHFPDGFTDAEEEFFIYSLVAAPEAGGELDPPLESLGINLYLSGAPAAAAYDLADAGADTMAFVYAPFPTAFEDLTDLQLQIDSLEVVNEGVEEGYQVVVYTLRGALDMSLDGVEGGTATVTVSF